MNCETATAEEERDEIQPEPEVLDAPGVQFGKPEMLPTMEGKY